MSSTSAYVLNGQPIPLCTFAVYVVVVLNLQMMLMNVLGSSSKLFGSLPKKNQHRKRKRLNTLIGNSTPQHRQIENSQHPQSSMTMSDLSRSISNRSVTFASVFDEPDNQTTIEPDVPMENEDLVVVVPNKYVLNEPIANKLNTEPYPFRSEVPLCLLPKSQSSTNINRTVHSKRKFPYHRAKKLKAIPSIDRSKSAPNLTLSSSTNNDHHRSLKTIRQWFNSSSVGRLIQSFVKHSKQKSISSRKSNDLIY